MIYVFDIDLADHDRGVFETLSIRAAQHPSESDEYLVARVLAYCLEYAEGIAFSAGGVSDPDDPPVVVRDATGALRAWVEIGTPDPARLHRASKASPRVAVYVHRDPTQFLKRIEGERIHRVEALEIYAVDRDLVAALVSRLSRRVGFSLSVSDRELTASFDDGPLVGRVRRCELPTNRQ